MQSGAPTLVFACGRDPLSGEVHGLSGLGVSRLIDLQPYGARLRRIPNLDTVVAGGCDFSAPRLGRGTHSGRIGIGSTANEEEECGQQLGGKTIGHEGVQAGDLP